MPTPPPHTPVTANGVIRTRFQGILGSGSAGFRLFWGTGTTYPFSDADLVTFATTVKTQFVSHVILNLSSQWSLLTVDAEDMSVGASGFGISGSTPAAGGNGGIPPASAATLISFPVASRWRGGHGRVYLPPLGAGTPISATVDTWGATALAALETGFGAFVSAVVASPIAVSLGVTNHVVLRYAPTGTPPDYLPYVVSGYVARSRIASQRRRIPR